jgi:hypothetical protein
MVIGKISSLATMAMVFALGLIFLKQAYGTSIGQSGQDVGAGLTGTAMGITNLIDAFISPITGLIGTFSSFFGSFSSNGSRSEPSSTGREDRKTPTQKVRSSDTSTITWSSGTSATVPTLSSEAKSYYRKLGVNVS